MCGCVRVRVPAAVEQVEREASSTQRRRWRQLRPNQRRSHHAPQQTAAGRWSQGRDALHGGRDEEERERGDEDLRLRCCCSAAAAPPLLLLRSLLLLVVVQVVVQLLLRAADSCLPRCKSTTMAMLRTSSIRMLRSAPLRTRSTSPSLPHTHTRTRSCWRCF